MTDLSVHTQTIQTLNDEFRLNLPPMTTSMIVSTGVIKWLEGKEHPLIALPKSLKTVTRFLALDDHSNGLTQCKGKEIYWFIHYFGKGHKMSGDPASAAECRRVIECLLWGEEVA